MRQWIGCLLCWLLVGSAWAQNIVVNEYLNDSSANGEYIELLVLTDKLDLRNYVIRDFTGSGGEGGTITFENISFWSSVRSGYIIVILLGSTSTIDDDFSDGIVQIGRTDDTYFARTGTVSIAADDDGVQIRDAGSNHVHILYHGNPPGSSDFATAAAMTPGAQAPSGNLDSPELVRFFDTNAVADYNNDSNAEKSTTFTQGAPNDATQASFRAKLLPIWINELQVDGGGTIDNAEFVEIVGPAGFSILGYTVFVTDCPVLGTPTTVTYTIDNGANNTTRSTFTDEVNKFGFYVLSDPTSGVPVNDQDLNQANFNETGQSDEDLPDAVTAANTSGAVVLRDANGNTVFEFGYGNCTDFINRIGTGVSDGLPSLSEGFLSDTKPTDADNAVKLTSTAGSSNSDGLGGGQQLPVELIAFEAVADGESVLLRWETASETNNAGFEIQQLSPTQNWDVLAFMEGHGTTEQAQAYAHRIDYLLPGDHRFRLKQIDYDGTFEYSPEVEVAIGVPGAYHLTSAYPNPFNPETTFSLSVARTQKVQVAVYDALGRRVALLYEGPFPAETSRAFRFEADALPSGVYLLRVLGEQFVTTQPLVLTK